MQTAPWLREAMANELCTRSLGVIRRTTSLPLRERLSKHYCRIVDRRPVSQVRSSMSQAESWEKDSPTMAYNRRMGKARGADRMSTQNNPIEKWKAPKSSQARRFKLIP